jgi:hypothetical protein
LGGSNSPQVDNGRAFEFAVAKALSETLEVEILESPSSINAQQSYKMISEKLRNRFDSASIKVTQHLIEKEITLIKKKPRAIWLPSDSVGQKGDVRDVIIGTENGEIGISCKTNHDAFKHSRLSGKADFVKSWGLDVNGCSDQYWTDVRPVFDELSKIRKASKATALWRFEPDVPDRFYWPVLNAFEREINRLNDKTDSEFSIASSLVTYIIGIKDFYKVTVRPDVVELQGFNLGGTLSVTKTRLPNQIIGIDKLNGGQYSKTIRFNRGFTFNFRIHNASSRIESSLKFDVTAVSLPPADVYTNHIML